MNELEIGKPVPDFTLPSSEGGSVSLSDFRGRKVLLYFYPKNMTPACTQEACDFRDLHDRVHARGADVLGISPDPVASHLKFRDKYGLPFPLLSDEDHRASEAFGVWQLKKMYGKEYMGVIRSTFLIGETGLLEAEWRKVRVKGHAEAVVGQLENE